MFRDFEIKRYRDGVVERALDTIATEEPLAIRILHWRKSARISENLAVTMRTPGADHELAAGLLLSEGVVSQPLEIAEIRSLGVEPSNEVLVELAQNVDFESWKQARHGFVSSSCGVCGKARMEQIEQNLPAVPAGDYRISPELVESLPRLLGEHQTAFNKTGGVHAAAFVSENRGVLAVREDIGRHNALDKVIGHALLHRQLPLDNGILFISSRGSFELVQKAAMAGAHTLASVGGPSSLAVETARRIGLTLICFVRDERFNVYAGDWRINWK